MFQAPLNNIVVKIYPKYIGNYSNIIKAANLNPGSQLNPADLVNIVGEVVSIPKGVSQGKFNFQGFTLKDIEVGDTVIVRFDVVFDMAENPESEVPLYNNMVWYKGQEFWLCRIDKLLAVIKKENQSIKMVNGYCMLSDVEEEARIYLPQTSKRIARAKEATLTHIGNPLEGHKRIEAFPDDRVLVHPYRLQHYQIKEKKFSICQQKDIFGRVVD